MADMTTIPAALRTRVGKGAARAARRGGLVPALIYGGARRPMMVNIERRRLERHLDQPGFFIRLIDIDIEGETHRVLPREVQLHPVSDAPLHVDFLHFSETRKLTVAVPVRFSNEEASPGLKRGGVLNVVRHQVEVVCTAINIPTEIEIDLDGYDIGGSVHSSAVTLPDGVVFAIADRDFTIATIAAPSVIAEADADRDEDEAEAPSAAAPTADQDG